MSMSGKEVLLLLLYAPVAKGGKANVPIRGRTRLAKMLFLFRQEVWPKFKFDQLIPRDVLPDFEPWKFGPYSKDVFADVEFLKNVGFLEVESVAEPAAPEEALELSYWSGTADVTATETEVTIEEYSQELFQLSTYGIQYVTEKRVWDGLSNQQQGALEQLKGKLVNAPLYVILKYVYDKYPEMTEKSEVKDRILGHA